LFVCLSLLCFILLIVKTFGTSLWALHESLLSITLGEAKKCLRIVCNALKKSHRDRLIDHKSDRRLTLATKKCSKFLATRECFLFLIFKCSDRKSRLLFGRSGFLLLFRAQTPNSRASDTKAGGDVFMCGARARRKMKNYKTSFPFSPCSAFFYYLRIDKSYFHVSYNNAYPTKLAIKCVHTARGRNERRLAKAKKNSPKRCKISCLSVCVNE
jgi:hypothetical protein